MFDLSAVRELLAATPDVLESWLAGLSPEWIHENEGGESWSPFDIVGHLVHGERTDWIPRVRHILDGRGDEPFEPFDRFAQFEESEGKTISDLLAEFRTLRGESLRTLDSFGLDEEQLDLPGTHPDFGAVDLRQLLATWTVHDLSHIAQIARVMAKQYRDDIGPWRAFIPIVRD